KIVVELSPILQFGLQAREEQNRLTKITYSPRGTTNETTLWLDVEEDAVIFGSSKGTIIEKSATLKDGGKRLGVVSVWSYGKVTVSQILELVQSDEEASKGQGGKLDTVVVGYTIKNNGTKEVTVSLETEIDTCVAGNDRNPFSYLNKKG